MVPGLQILQAPRLWDRAARWGHQGYWRPKQKAVSAKTETAFLILVPAAGIEPARLAAGDSELAIYSVSTGKRGEF